MRHISPFFVSVSERLSTHYVTFKIFNKVKIGNSVFCNETVTTVEKM